MKAKTVFQKVLDAHGLTLSEVIARGIPKGTACAHYYGIRNLSLSSAFRYAERLKIPLTDLVQPTATPTTPPEPASGQGNDDAA